MYYSFTGNQLKYAITQFKLFMAPTLNYSE